MTPNLSLALISAAQSQKHVTANEATIGLDALAQLAVIGVVNAPPGSPSDGDCYIVGASPIGAFESGAQDNVASYYNGVWTFYTPKSGWIAYRQDASKFYAFNGASWVLLSTLL